jgi:hypothetical protein
MATEGIEAVFLETHNWGKAAKFFQALGFELEVSAGDGSGVFRNGSSSRRSPRIESRRYRSR